MNPSFHHFGLAVKRFDEAIRFHENLGYKVGNRAEDPLQKVELMMLHSTAMPDVELIKPISEESPINGYLKKSNEIIYHVCYEVNSEEEQRHLLSTGRALCISQPKPAVLFGGRPVSFFYVKNVGIIEILSNV